MLGRAQGPPDGAEHAGQHHVLGEATEARGTATEGLGDLPGVKMEKCVYEGRGRKKPTEDSPGSLHPSSSRPAEELLWPPLPLPLPHPHSWPIPPCGLWKRRCVRWASSTQRRWLPPGALHGEL